MLAMAVLVSVIVLVMIAVPAIRFGIGPMPSSRPAAETVLAALKETGGEGAVYELGSGWGTLAIAIARRMPGRHVIAIEVSLIPYAVGRLVGYVLRVKNVDWVWGDFLRMPLKEAPVAVCYLCPELMTALKRKLDSEPHGITTLISNTFALPGRQSSARYVIRDLWNSPLYRYDVSP